MSFIPVLKLAVLASILSFIFYAAAIKRLGVIRTNVFINLIPALTAVFAYFILQESFSSYKIAGIIVVIVGVLLSQFHDIRKTLTKS